MGSHIIPPHVSCQGFKGLEFPEFLEFLGFLEYPQFLGFIWFVWFIRFVQLTFGSNVSSGEPGRGPGPRYHFSSGLRSGTKGHSHAPFMAVSMSNGRWTFYEAVNSRFTQFEMLLCFTRHILLYLVFLNGNITAFFVTSSTSFNIGFPFSASSLSPLMFVVNVWIIVNASLQFLGCRKTCLGRI